MTIALGVLCRDGAVLGVDLEYNQDFISSAGQKMFWLPQYFAEANYFLLIGVAGNPDTGKTFIELLESHLAIDYADGNATMQGLKTSIKKALKQVWHEHVDSAPSNERVSLGCDMVIAVRADNQVRLFKTNRTMLIEEKAWTCRGAGLYLAYYLMDRVLGPRPTVELAAQVVSYVIAAAKEHIHSVGKGSDVKILPANGLSYSFLRQDCVQVEERFTELFRAFREIIACADPVNVTGEQMERKFASLQDVVRKLRLDQDERIKAKKRRQEVLS
jgi:20S proteasome alpha/beta subunit